MQLGNRTTRAFVALLAITAIGAACGDDDDDDAADTTTTEAEAEDETTSTTTGDNGVNPEFAEYCAFSEEFDQQEEFPTVDQLTELLAVTPDEIREPMEAVVAGFTAASEAGDPEAAFADPEVTSAVEVIEEFEAENCGVDDEEATADIDPEFADYCSIAIELNEQPSLPTEEQLNEIRTAAPDEIRSQIEYVVEAFLAALAEGTPEAPFADPAVEENFGPIEEFDAEHCGIDAEE